MTTADTGLFKESYERDSCGFGLIANLDDQPSRWLVDTAIVSSTASPTVALSPRTVKRVTVAVCC